MEKITKEQRKRYNNYVEQKNIQNAQAAGALPLVLIGLLGFAYVSNEYVSGKLALAFIVIACLIAIISTRHPKSDIEKHL